MGATEEQMALLSGANVSHVSYILILYSIAFLLFLFVAMLLNLYAAHAWPLDKDKVMKTNKGLGEGTANGAPRENGHLDRRMRDAEDFELEGLMTDDEEDDKPGVKHGQST